MKVNLSKDQIETLIFILENMNLREEGIEMLKSLKESLTNDPEQIIIKKSHCDCYYQELWLNGKKVIEGNRYEDNVGSVIGGFLQALKQYKIKFDEKTIEFECPVCDYKEEYIFE
jgi:hypothetical protein